MKEMLRDWEKRYPGRVETIFTALQNVAPSQLADRKMFDFLGLENRRTPNLASGVLTERGDGLDVLEL
jgi:tRNA 2-thiocytidine biosynthesis protein TtcA